MWYVKKVLKNPMLPAALFLTTVLMLMGCGEDLAVAKNNPVNILYCYVITNSIGIVSVLVPVLTSVPFLSVYVEEHKKKMEYYQVVRSKSRRRYYGSEWLAALISAFAVAAVSLIFFTLICRLAGAGWESSQAVSNYFQGTYYEGLIRHGRMTEAYLIHCLAFILYSLPWPIFGMLISFVTENSYVILASPFILFLAANYLTEFLSLNTLSPGMALLTGNQLIHLPFGGIFHTVRYFAAFLAILTILLMITVREKMNHEGM